MFSLSEHRLTHYTAKTFQKRLVSDSTVTSPSKVEQQTTTLRASRLRTPESNVPAGQATPLPQPEREQARQDFIADFSGPEVVSDIDRLTEMRAEGTITPQQFQAAAEKINQGFSVDPLGFDAGEVREQVGGTKEQVTGQDIQDTRAPANEPLQSTLSGAGGQLGATGGIDGFDPTKAVSATTRAQREAEIKNMRVNKLVQYTKKDGTIGYRQVFDPAATQQAQDEALNRLQQEEQMRFETDQQRKDFQTSGDQFGVPGGISLPQASIQTTNQLNGLYQAALQNPSMAEFAPIIASLMGRQSEFDAEFVRNQALLGLGASDRDGDGITDGLAAAAANEQLIAERRANKRDDMNAEQRDIALQAAELSRQIGEASANIQKMDNLRAENLQREANIEAEKKNRRIANKLGITTDGSGLEWMQSEIRKGNEALSYIIERGAASLSLTNLQTAQNYDLSVRKALSTYDQNQFNIDEQLRLDLKSIRETVSLDAEERSKERKKIWEKYYETKQKEDERSAEDLRVLAKEMFSVIKENQKTRTDSLVTTGDSISFIQDTRKLVFADDVIKDATTVNKSFNAMQAAWTRFESLPEDQRSRIGTDNAVITLAQKILDPSSVVRESEYARIPDNASTLDKLYGKIVKFTQGGAGLVESDMREIVEASRAVKESYDREVEQRLQPYILDIGRFNSQNVESPVEITDVLPPNMIPQLSPAIVDTWRSQIKGTQASIGSTGKTESAPGFLSPENAPSGGYRTDRHNNPTAFTTTIAKQAGLQEGVDYEVGDAFPNNPNLKTAKLIGDPFSVTRRVIDKIGFYTGGGQQRWTHTAMSKDAWDALSTNQKDQVIMAMYQEEGGTGVLGDTQIAAAPTGGEPSFNPVPTATAAEPEVSGLPNPTIEEVRAIASASPDKKNTIIRQLLALREGKEELANIDLPAEIKVMLGQKLSRGESAGFGGRLLARSAANRVLRPMGESVIDTASGVVDIGGKLFNATGDFASGFFNQ